MTNEEHQPGVKSEIRWVQHQNRWRYSIWSDTQGYVSAGWRLTREQAEIAVAAALNSYLSPRRRVG